jgi:hypothetical protein
MEIGKNRNGFVFIFLMQMFEFSRTYLMKLAQNMTNGTITSLDDITASKTKQNFRKEVP